MAILYICDRKACENCSEKCKYTTDIRHAVNFEPYHADGVEDGDFWEKEPNITIPSIWRSHELEPSNFTYTTPISATERLNSIGALFSRDLNTKGD